MLTFNYSGDNRTMTLKEIDAGLQQGARIPEINAYQKADTHLGIRFLAFWEEETRKMKCGVDERRRRRPDGAEPLFSPKVKM